MRFAKSLAFWKTETSDPRIESFLGERVIDGLLWGAIGNDKHLEVLDGLGSHALQCERQIDRRPDEWEQNGEAGRHVLLDLWVSKGVSAFDLARRRNAVSTL